MVIKIKDFYAHCESNPCLLWEAWANSAKSQIVVHRHIKWACTPGDYWVLAHRNSGRCIKSWCFTYETRKAALFAARKIEKIFAWETMGRSIDAYSKPKGWCDRRMQIVSNKIDRILSC
jgi:hypothetical protein